jgi:hypothetical protein
LALAAGLGGALMWVTFGAFTRLAVGLAALASGIVGIVLGSAVVWRPREGSRDRWLGVGDMVLGAIPVGTVVVLVVGGLTGWVEFR